MTATMHSNPPAEFRPPRLVRFWRSDARRRFVGNRIGLVSLVFLALMILAIIVGPWFAQDPNFADVTIRLQPPSAEHLLGTDQLGRDILARILAGGRASMIVSFGATGIALVIGVFLGLVAGYRGGFLDEAVSRASDVLLAFPTILLGIMVVAAFGASLPAVVLAISIATVPLVARLTRAGVLSVRPREYVQGVIALGIPTWRILARHVLPNVIVPVLVILTGNMGRLALSESALSFLGAGVQPPDASWGNMIAESQPYLQYAWWVPVIPGTVLTIVILAFCYVGDALRDALDVRELVGRADVP